MTPAKKKNRAFTRATRCVPQHSAKLSLGALHAARVLAICSAPVALATACLTPTAHAVTLTIPDSTTWYYDGVNLDTGSGPTPFTWGGLNIFRFTSSATTPASVTSALWINGDVTFTGTSVGSQSDWPFYFPVGGSGLISLLGNLTIAECRNSGGGGGAVTVAPGAAFGIRAGGSTQRIIRFVYNETIGSASGGAISNMGNMVIAGGSGMGLWGLAFFDGNKSAKHGGAIHNYAQVEDATIRIAAGTFFRNVASTSGGAIHNAAYTASAVVTFESTAHFGDKDTVGSGNRAYEGGAIYNDGPGVQTNLEGTESYFYRNEALASGGAIYNRAGSTLTILGIAHFGDKGVAGSGNGGSGFGGGIYNTGAGSQVNLNGVSHFYRNEVLESGGAIFNMDGGIVNIAKIVYFGDKETPDSGNIGSAAGAIHNIGSNSLINLNGAESHFYRNVAAASGGAISNESGGVVTITGIANFGDKTEAGSGNISTEFPVAPGSMFFGGGAIYNTGVGSQIVLNGTESHFYRNVTADIGGAIFNRGGGVVTISGTAHFGDKTEANSGNISEGNHGIYGFRRGGGAIYNEGAGSQINLNGTESHFYRNVAAGEGGAIFNRSEGVVTILGKAYFGDKDVAGSGNIAGSGFSGGAICNGEGTVELKGSESHFYRNEATYGGAIGAGGGTLLTIDNNVFFGDKSVVGSGNIANESGGAIATCAYRAQINLNGTETHFYRNQALYGGAIYNFESGVLTINGEVFFGDKETPDSGNIATGTSAYEGGGAIFNTWSRINLNGPESHFYRNVAASEGGAIYNTNEGVVTITGIANFGDKTEAGSGNIANGVVNGGSIDGGGAIYNVMVGSIINLNGPESRFYRNEAVSSGGAILNSSGGVVTIAGIARFGDESIVDSGNKGTNNSAGGAIYNGGAGSQINLNGTESHFYRNTTTHVGGAISNYSGGTVTIGGTARFGGENGLSGNTARSGGAIDNGEAGARINLNGDTSHFYGNRAENDGGAIHNTTDGVVTIEGIARFGNLSFSNSGNITHNSYSDSTGGAIYNEGAGALINLNGAESYFYRSKADRNGGAIANWQGGVVTIEGIAHFGDKSASGSGNTARATSADVGWGGAIQNQDVGSRINLNGAEVHFYRNEAHRDGGAIYNFVGGVMTIEGIAHFGDKTTPNSGNIGTSDGSSGGAIANYGAGAQINLNGAESHFYRNKVGGSSSSPSRPLGGAIYNYNSGIVTIEGIAHFGDKDTTGSGNIALSTGSGSVRTGAGGAISSTGGSAQMNLKSDAYFYRNEAGEDGGAIYNSRTLTIDGIAYFGDSVVANSGNIAANGGAIYNLEPGARINLNGTESYFYRNAASTDSGGAIRNASGGVVTIEGIAYFGDKDIVGSGNTSARQGGAIYNAAGAATQIRLKGVESHFYRNTASIEDGGAINNTFGAVVTIDGIALFGDKDIVGSGNTSGECGGAISNDGVTGQINLNGAGSYFYRNVAGFAGGAIRNVGRGVVTIEGVALFGDKDIAGSGNIAGSSGGAIHNYANSQINLNAPSHFYRNEASYEGGAIYNDGTSQINLNAPSHFYLNEAGNDGGAIYNTLASIYFENVASFINNNAGQYGGAIGNYCAQIFFNGSAVFIGNTVTGAGLFPDDDQGGGAIWNNEGTIYFGDDNKDTFTFIDNALLKPTETGSRGGAIYHIVGGEIIFAGVAHFSKQIDQWAGLEDESNKNIPMAYDGGAIYNMDSSRVWITAENPMDGLKNRFMYNVAHHSGGAIYNNHDPLLGLGSPSVTLRNPEFKFNKALTGDGGAIYAVNTVNNGKLDIQGNSFFVQNEAAGSGGAIYFSDTGTTSQLLIDSGAMFTGNKAGGNGGAIFYQDTETLTLPDASFGGNKAEGHGGAIYVSNADLVLENPVFLNNTADGPNSLGGAIHASGNIDIYTGGFGLFSGNKDLYGANAIHGGAASITLTVAVAGGAVLDVRDPMEVDGFLNKTGDGTLYLGGVSALNSIWSINLAEGALHLYRQGEVTNGQNGLVETAKIHSHTFRTGNGVTISIGGGHTTDGNLISGLNEVVFGDNNKFSFDLAHHGDFGRTNIDTMLTLMSGLHGLTPGSGHTVNLASLANSASEYKLIKSVDLSYPVPFALGTFAAAPTIMGDALSTTRAAGMYSVERRNSNTELWLKVNDTTAGLLGKTLTWNGGSAEWNQTSTGLWTGGATQYLTGDHVNFTGGGDDIVTFTNNGVAPASVTVNNTGAFHFDNSGTGNGPGITGDTGVVKEGTGSLTIAGTHSYKGTTDIKQGIVIVTGDLRRADGKIFVRSGAILGGKGHIGGEVQVAGGGCLSLLGNLPGVAGPDTNYTLSFSNNVIIAPGAAIVLNIKGNNATGYEHDVLNFTNAGANKLTLTGGTLYVNINYTGGVSDIPEFALSVVTGAILNYDDVKSLNIVPCMIGGNGTSVSLLLDINGVLRAGEAVPEPSTYGLLSGLVALGYIIWRRRKKKQPSAPPTTNQQPNAQREAP